MPLGIIFALLAGCIYGTVPVSTRYGIVEGMAAIELISFRTLIVALVLIAIAVMNSERFAIPKALLPAFALQCAATLGVSVTYLMSLQFIPVGLAVIVFFTFPAIIAIAAPLWEGQKPNTFKTVMSLAAFVGLLIAVGPEFGGANVTGIGLAAIAAVSCALQFISGRSLGEVMKPAAFGGLTHLVITPFVIGTAVWLGHSPFGFLWPESGSPSAFLTMAAVALGYLGGYFFAMTSLTYSRPSAVAPYFNIEPVVTTVLALVILGERLNMNQYVGGAIVLAAIILASTLGERKELR